MGVTRSQRVINWRKRTKERALVYKGGKCLVCAYQRCNAALQFHHIDPAEKDFSIGGSTRAWATIKAELDKCALLCSNCHTEVHEGLDLTPYLAASPSPKEGDRLLSLAGIAPRPPAKRSKLTCKDCGATIWKRASRCRRCAGRHHQPTKTQWPSPGDLLVEVQMTSCVRVAQRLGVSEAAVRKRMRKHPTH
jgi:hypothetical protein